MALVAVAGIYDNGKVELEETPAGVESARVIVTFLPSESAQVTHADSEHITREALRARFKARLRRGMDFRDESIPTREQIYEQRNQQFG